MSVAQLVTELVDSELVEAVPDETPPLPVKVIDDLATLRLLSDPLRLQLIEELGAAPTTVKALARAMGMKPNRLYYHVNLLEQHGLVRVTQTRIVSGIVERTYALVARHFAVSDDLALPVDVKRDVTDTLFRGGPADCVGRMQVWLTDQEREGFEEQLGELLEKYGAGEPHRPDAEADADPYTMLFALYAPVGQTAKRTR